MYNDRLVSSIFKKNRRTLILIMRLNRSVSALCNNFAHIIIDIQRIKLLFFTLSTHYFMSHLYESLKVVDI